MKYSIRSYQSGQYKRLNRSLGLSCWEENTLFRRLGFKHMGRVSDSRGGVFRCPCSSHWWPSWLCHAEQGSKTAKGPRKFWACFFVHMQQACRKSTERTWFLGGLDADTRSHVEAIPGHQRHLFTCFVEGLTHVLHSGMPGSSCWIQEWAILQRTALADQRLSLVYFFLNNNFYFILLIYLKHLRTGLSPRTQGRWQQYKNTMIKEWTLKQQK